LAGKIKSGKKLQNVGSTIMTDTTDPLLAPNPGRFVLFPIRYHAVWEMYKKHEVKHYAERFPCFCDGQFLIFCCIGEFLDGGGG
jgi:hypothetical protein